jgi:hypothetical protein
MDSSGSQNYLVCVRVCVIRVNNYDRPRPLIACEVIIAKRASQSCMAVYL